MRYSLVISDAAMIATSFPVLECYMGLFPSLICKNYIFRYFVKTVKATSLKFCTGNSTSGEDNCASKICEFFQCACANLCSVKRRNGNSFYLLQKAEILVVVTLDRLLPEANRTFTDLFE